MMTRILAGLMFVMFVSACGLFNMNHNSNSHNSNNSNNSNSSSKSNSKGDFSSPKAGAETFLKAAVDKDVELLSQCFDADVEREFRPFQSKTAPQKDLDSLSSQMKGATVGKETINGDTANVEVIRNGDADMIIMKRSADGWKVRGF